MSDERWEIRGTILEDRYRVGACIGVGGSGIVFEGTRLVDGARVVLKMLREGVADDPSIRKRLVREAEVSRAVNHSGMAQVSDVGFLPDGSPYLVMRRAEGESLHALLRRRGRLEPDEVALIGAKVASILHHVHAAGFVHRDVKPEHIMLDKSPLGDLHVTLIDFGICVSAQTPLDEREAERGRVYGTPSYASPEQASGDPFVDGRADLWGLGVTLYEALSGVLPYRNANVMQLLRSIIADEAPCLVRRSAIPVELADVVHRMLRHDRGERFPTGRAAARALSEATSERRDAESRLSMRLLRSAYSASEQPTLSEGLAL